MPEEKDGKVKLDLGQTYSEGAQVKFDPETLLVAMARRQRDGASLSAIISEFDLVGAARSPYTLQRALNVGHNLLDQQIKAGKSPEETVTWVDKESGPISPDDKEDED